MLSTKLFTALYHKGLVKGAMRAYSVVSSQLGELPAKFLSWLCCWQGRVSSEHAKSRNHNIVLYPQLVRALRT